MQFVSNAFNTVMANPLWAACRFSQAAGAVGILAFTANSYLSARQVTRENESLEAARAARAAFVLTERGYLVSIGNRELKFGSKATHGNGEDADPVPVKSTLREIQALLAPFNRPGQEAVRAYKGAVDQLLGQITLKVEAVRGEIVTKLTDLAAAIEGDNAKADVNALINTLNAPNQTPSTLRDALLGKKAENGGRERIGLCEILDNHAFPEVDGLRAGDIEAFAAEKSEELKSAAIKTGEETTVRDGLNKIFSNQAEDSALKVMFDGLKGTEDYLTPKVATLNAWNEKNYGVLKKCIKVFTSESPYQGAAIKTTSSLALLLLGTAALHFGPRFNLPVVPAAA
jgi:hypothetical protein